MPILFVRFAAWYCGLVGYFVLLQLIVQVMRWLVCPCALLVIRRLGGLLAARFILLFKVDCYLYD